LAWGHDLRSLAGVQLDRGRSSVAIPLPVRVSAQIAREVQFPGTAVNLSATLLGAGLGMESQRRREMAGLRTNTLVAIGAYLCHLRRPHSAASSVRARRRPSFAFVA